MKKPSKPFALLALGIVIFTSQLSLVSMSGKSMEKISPVTTSNFVSTLPKSASDDGREAGLADGLYLIKREARTREELGPLVDSEKVLVNDYEFLSPEERGETSYIVVSSGAYVPIILSGDPVKTNDQTGKPKLEISLAEDQIQPLEKFTRENVMRSVAIVIGGKVVTMHKIRVPIVGGKMQITRCTDHGCEALYTQLKKH